MSLTSIDLGTKISLLLALGVIVTACGNSTGPDGVVGEFVESNGVQRTYRMHLPQSYTEDNPVPLVVYCIFSLLPALGSFHPFTLLNWLASWQPDGAARRLKF